MKHATKHIAILCCLLAFFNCSLYAAIPQGMSWEVRTGGSDTVNSGGFDAGASTGCTGGTDRSTRDTPFVAFNGTTITATTAGVGAVLTITGYTPVTADKCNTLLITGGVNFTTGLYVITASGGGTWTVDRNATSGAGTAMTGSMGGGFATVGKGVSLWNTSGGDNTWILAGTYTVTAAIVPATVTGTLGLNTGNVSGYTTSHGDSGIATITSATNSVNLWSLSSSIRFITFKQLTMTHTAGTRGDCVRSVTTNYVINFKNVTMDGCQIGINADASGGGDIWNVTIADSEIKNSIGAAITARCGVTVENSYIHNNAGAGLNLTGCQQGITQQVLGSVFYANLYGVFHSNATALETIVLTGNDFVSATADNLRFSSTAGVNLTLRNNVIYGAAVYGINNTPASTTLTPWVNDHNAYGANTTADRFQTTAGTSDVALSADPFVGRTTGNFLPNTTAGGGAALKDAGFPGTIPNAGTGFAYIGALSPQAASGSANFGVVQ